MKENKITNCRLCNSKNLLYVFDKTILKKYEVKYYQCQNCFYLQTDTPYWLTEAYKINLVSNDSGKIIRTRVLSKLINENFNKKLKYLDFGCGTQELLQELKKYNFEFLDGYDKYLHSSFIPLQKNYDYIFCFEVLEHLLNPLEEILTILSYSKNNNLLFSTTLYDIPNPNNKYLASEFGQHIGIYHLKTLNYISDKYKLILFTNNFDIHGFNLPSKINLNNYMIK